MDAFRMATTATADGRTNPPRRATSLPRQEREPKADVHKPESYPVRLFR